MIDLLWWIRRFFLLLLLAAPAHAATFSYSFENAPVRPDAPMCNAVGTFTNGGITATFGSKFTFSRSLDIAGLPSESCARCAT